ncbi:MAG TPA: hypothetical protein VKV20_07710 [Ktedonobacteraceae bacterium]|jgi:hypothetical protein|nr:hypothetical protein [Ktedonobacteraceae bacterium]
MEKQGFKFYILRVLAHRLQHWADFLSSQTGEDERSGARERVNVETAQMVSMGDDAGVVSTPEPGIETGNTGDMPSHWIARVRAAEPPAGWLARVQKDAPSLLTHKVSPKQSLAAQPRALAARQADTHTPLTGIGAGHDRNTAGQPHTQSSSSNVGAAPVTDMGIELKSHEAGSTPVVKEVGKREGKDKPRREENEVRQDKTTVSAPVLKQHEVEEVGRNTGQVRNNNQEAISKLSSRTGSLNQPMEQGASPVEAKRPSNANQGTELNYWPQVGLSRPVYGDRRARASISEALEQIQQLSYWPALPQEELVDDQEWEMVRRAWERRRRLDEEQRGRTWNA